jgi:hypothetical protein
MQQIGDTALIQYRRYSFFYVGVGLDTKSALRSYGAGNRNDFAVYPRFMTILIRRNDGVDGFKQKKYHLIILQFQVPALMIMRWVTPSRGPPAGAERSEHRRGM